MARYAGEADSLADRNGWPPGLEDMLSYPHSALLWNQASGGKNCFPAERDLFDRLGAAVPHPVFSQIVQANNAFAHRVVAELQAVGITQFIDLGPGIPADGLPPTDVRSLYGSVLRAGRDSKVVYVDNDPIVLAHTRALRDQPGQVLVIDGDIYQPKEILDNAELSKFLDWTKPIGLICTAVLHEHPGPVDEITGIMAAYVDHLPAGSYTAISHFLDTEDAYAEGIVRPLEMVLQSETAGCSFRTLDEIKTLFPGQQIQDPGVVRCRQWRNPTYDVEALMSNGEGIAGGIGRVYDSGKLA